MMRITPIPAFQDNYIWILENHSSKTAVVVDPGIAEPVIQYLEQKKLSLTTILITHHHGDHTGGIQSLANNFPDLIVYGPKKEKIAGITYNISEGDNITIPGHNINFAIFEIPGHTLGHIAYYSEAQSLLFCGDTLFAAGCGYLFEGTPAQMHNSLSKLAALPKDTKVYCTHEYTESNIAFAVCVEPENTALLERQQRVTRVRAQGLPSLPSTIELELTTNPFLRTHEKSVKQAAERHANKPLQTTEQVFAEIRAWKNQF